MAELDNASPYGEEGTAGTLKEKDTKSAFDPKKPGMSVGDYKITKLRLLSPVRGLDKPIDLQAQDSAWSEINFYENINSPFVSGDISVMDGVGLVEYVPMVGEEFLEVHLQTAGGKLAPIGNPGQSRADVSPDQLPSIIKTTFRIFKIDPPQKANDNFRLLKFHFVSDTQISNMMIRVQKNYPANEIQANYKPNSPAEDKTYTIADMARDIYVDAFHGKKTPIRHKKTRKEFLVEPTKGVYSASIPNWTPFKALTFLASRAISSNRYSGGANFVFYETLKGFRFISIETLMMGGFRGYTETQQFPTKCEIYNQAPTMVEASTKKMPYIPVFSDGTLGEPPFVPITGAPGTQGKSYVAVYSYSPANVKDQSTLEKMYSVNSYSLVHTFDTVLNLGLGMYANRVITHDIVRMKWNKQDFHYIQPEDVVSLLDQDTQSTVQTPNPDKPADDEDTIVDTFIRSDPGKQCSNAADMLGRPESHISLFPTNSGISTKFAEGIRSVTYRTEDGEVEAGADFQAKNVHGKAPSENPIEMEKRVEEWLAQGISQKRQRDTVKINFDAPGDSAREVGDLIWFNFPSENPKFAEGGQGIQESHKYFSGKFLITALRHRITNKEYTMHVEAIKDGYRSQITPTFTKNNTTVFSPDGTTAIGKSN